MHNTAHQYGVPMKVLRRPTVLSSCALTPKSTTFHNIYYRNNASNMHTLGKTGNQMQIQIVCDHTEKVFSS